MSEDLQSKWDSRYRDADGRAVGPARVVQEYAHLLPDGGTALDLACGLGGNARFLARKGLTVYAWDISPVAIETLQRLEGPGPTLTTEVRDVVAHPPEADRFDVIVVSHFLERSLAAALSQALRPGGLLFYQTFTRERVSDAGPSQDAFRLAPNELLQLFAKLRVVAYREEGTLGQIDRGYRNEALLVALKPPSMS